MGKADLRCKAIGDNAAEIAFYAAACDMGHAMESFPAEQTLNRFIIGGVGLHCVDDQRLNGGLPAHKRARTATQNRRL